MPAKRRAAASPYVAARRGQGRADARGPWHRLLLRAEVPRTGDSSSSLGDPVHYEFNLVSAQISSRSRATAPTVS